MVPEQFEYDPMQDPDPDAWRGTDEQERIQTILRWHRRAKVELPEDAYMLHATMHTMSEGMLAERHPPAVRALERLQKQGLDRHEAIHAIASVMLDYLFGAGDDVHPDPEKNRARLDAALEKLTKKSYYERFGD